MALKKPNALKLLEGNPGKRPIKKGPDNKADKLHCPAWLNIEAKREWKKIVPYLKKAGFINNGDKAVLASYCQNYARWKQAETALDNEDLKVIGRAGYMPNPLAKMSAQYHAMMNTAIKKLGLSPSDRANLDMIMDDELTEDEKTMIELLK
jgi:P27 family predicted phage terminase small subunit